MSGGIVRLVLSFILSALTASAGQVVDLLRHGAIGDGEHDDSAAIQQAIDTAPEGSVIDFGTGRTFLIGRSLVLKPGTRYVGTSTLQMSRAGTPGAPLLRVPYGSAHDVSLEGLTLDANSVGGVLTVNAGGGASISADRIIVRSCHFKNCRSGDLWESAIYAPVGLRFSIIAQNTFERCGTFIYATSPHHLVISGNSFDTTAGGNAISIVLNDYPFEFGEQLEITQNTFRNLKRMGIEIFGRPPRDPLNSPLIASNRFFGWQEETSHDPFGISVVSGHSARIRDNVLEGGRAGYGIEVGVAGAQVAGNRISGFPIGIVIQGQPGATLEKNLLRGQTDSAIVLSNAASNPRATIIDNQVIDPKNRWIDMAPNDYAGLTVRGNVFERRGGAFPDDAGRAFWGIKLDAGLSGTVEVSGNYFIQTASDPPPGFTFNAISVFGPVSGSRIEGNHFISESTQPFGNGLLLWFAPFLNGAEVNRNEFVNFAQISNGFTSGSVRSVDNVACGVRNPNALGPTLRNRSGCQVAPTPSRTGEK